MHKAAHFVLETAAVKARIMTRTDTSWLWSNFQGYNIDGCVRVCG